MNLVLFAVALLAQTALADSRLIHGQPVPAGSFTEVVKIVTGTSGCTATIVGKRVLLTAAHCGSTGATSKFSLDGKQYTGKVTRSSLYPGKDHDVAVIVTSEDIAGKPASVGGTAEKGKSVTLLGYGCTQPGGGGGSDGILRYGTTTITAFAGFDMVSKQAGGAALCFGDSGGPLFDSVGGKHKLLGINSKGNIQDTNYNTRLDIDESKKFLEDVIASQKVDICGVNVDCDGPPPPPPPGPIVVENDAVKITVMNKGKHDDAYVKVHTENLARFLAEVPTDGIPIPLPEPADMPVIHTDPDFFVPDVGGGSHSPSPGPTPGRRAWDVTFVPLARTASVERCQPPKNCLDR